MIPLHDDNPTRRQPVVTIVLIALNVIVFFFWQERDGGPREVNFLYRQAAVPCEVTSGEPVEQGTRGQPTCDGSSERRVFPEKNVYLAVLVSMFLHGSILHIAGNMLFLWTFGNNIEDDLGPVLYLAFYVVAGLVAAMAHIVLFRTSAVPVVGASGAIAGVMGAYLVRFPRARVLTLISFFAIWIPSWIVLGVWFIGQFLISSADSGVATAAHIGGFLFGLAFGLVYLRPRAARRQIRSVQPEPYWR